MKFVPFLAAAALAAAASCSSDRPAGLRTGADSLRAIAETIEYRRSAEEFLLHHPDSPFKADPPIPFEGLRWYPPDPSFYFTSQLHRYPDPETVVVVGTGGEPRRQLRYGYFLLPIDGEEHRLNVYKFPPDLVRNHPDLARTLSVWFTDETTGRDTYPVGRYLDVEPESPDPEHEYVVNLNNAHNPYCAYNPSYSCAIPTEEDRIPVPIRAGEMTYHVD